MGKGGRDRAWQRGGKDTGRYGGRGRSDDRWDPADRRHDPGRDLSDLYEDLQDAGNDEYVWPEFDDESED